VPERAGKMGDGMIGTESIDNVLRIKVRKAK